MEISPFSCELNWLIALIDIQRRDFPPMHHIVHCQFITKRLCHAQVQEEQLGLLSWSHACNSFARVVARSNWSTGIERDLDGSSLNERKYERKSFLHALQCSPLGTVLGIVPHGAKIAVT